MGASTATVKVGIIGSGGIARGVHLPSLSEMEDVEIVAICDVIASRAEEQAAKYGVERTYTLFREMFAEEDLDAVFALVEPGNMFHVAWASLHAGYPTFIEKPPGITAAQAEALARKADEAGVILQVGFNRRFIPAVRRARELVLERTHVTQVEGCFLKFGRGAFDKGSLSAFSSDTVHAVDLIRWLAGAERAEKIAMVTAQYDDAVVNAWNGVCLFDNGVTGIIKANYRVGGRVHQFQMHGPGVSAFMDCGCGAPAASATILAHKGAEKYSLASAGAADEGCVTFDSREMAGSDAFHRYYGFFQEDRHFVDCVRDGAVPECDIHEAVKSMRLVEDFLASAL
jgi:virulence factor